MEKIMLGIKCKPKTENYPASGLETEIYETKTGNLVGGVIAIDIGIRANEFVTAKLEMELTEIDLENVEVKEVTFFERITGKKYKLVEIKGD